MRCRHGLRTAIGQRWRGSTAPLLLLALVTSSCTREPSLGGVAAVVQRWDIRDAPGFTVGVLGGFARCGDDAFVSDVNGLRIRRLSLSGGPRLPSIDVGMPPFSLATDCSRGVVAFASGTGRGLVVRELDWRSGAPGREFALPGQLFPQGGMQIGADEITIGGVWMAQRGREAREAIPADRFFADQPIAARLRVSDGSIEPAFIPFDHRCLASAGQCVRAGWSAAPADAPFRWVVTQPTSDHVGLYDEARRLLRTQAIQSPGFTRTGAALPATASAEDGLRWAVDNSLVWNAYVANGRLAVVYHRVVLPNDWSFGVQVQFAAWMNVYGLDGRPIALDVSLPELPIGQDDTHLYVAHYGADGRQGQHERVELLRVALPH